MTVLLKQMQPKNYVAPISAQANSRSEVKPMVFLIGGRSQNRRLQKGLPA